MPPTALHVRTPDLSGPSFGEDIILFLALLCDRIPAKSAPFSQLHHIFSANYQILAF